MTLYDKTGRKMEDGDLFRVLHFTDRKRRKRWLYFFLKHTPEFTTKWWGVDIRGGFDSHRWPVYENDGWNMEIMNSLTVKSPKGGYDDFVERPINREVLEQRKKEEARNDPE